MAVTYKSPRHPHPPRFLSATRLSVQRDVDPISYYENLTQLNSPVDTLVDSEDDFGTSKSGSKKRMSEAFPLPVATVVQQLIISAPPSPVPLLPKEGLHSITFEASDDCGVRMKDLLSERRAYLRRAMENGDELVLSGIEASTIFITVKWPGYISYKTPLLLTMKPSRLTRFALATEIAKELVRFVARRKIMMCTDRRWAFGDPLKGGFSFEDLILVSIFRDEWCNGPENEWEIEMAVDKVTYRDMTSQFVFQPLTPTVTAS